MTRAVTATAVCLVRLKVRVVTSSTAKVTNGAGHDVDCPRSQQSMQLRRGDSLLRRIDPGVRRSAGRTEVDW